MAVCLLAGCVHADAAIAQSIEQARPDVVERAVYEPATFIDQAVIKVFVKPGTPSAEAVALAGEVVQPRWRPNGRIPISCGRSIARTVA